MSKLERKTKEKEEINALPPELIPIYNQLVAEYQFHCLKRYSVPFVNRVILADLVKDGWRPSHQPLNFSDEKNDG
jgi:hypothetical protein